MDYFSDMESRIPTGRVRTRFAPSPTGYMHVGGLRTALYAYIIARQNGGDFLLRIEDTDQSRFVEGSIQVIYDTLLGSGLIYDEGPDIGGPVGPYVQTERREIYARYAERLLERGGAYRCFCAPQEYASLGDGEKCACSRLSAEESDGRAASGANYVIRQRIPGGGSTTFSDPVFGDITAQNVSLDDNVLIKSDGLPTYNFANVIDDHLMGITHVVRGSEYLASAPKYNLLYDAFGWTPPLYVHCSTVMKDAQNKLSKRKGDPTYDDLLAEGYLKDAVMNYVALLGWSPGGEREIFSLDELVQAFDIRGLSKSPAIFDKDKLKWFNSEYIKALPPEDFYAMALPYLGLSGERLDLKAVCALAQSRCEVLSDLHERVDFFDALPEYDTELYIHKKMKTDRTNSLAALIEVLPALEAIDDWDEQAVHDALFSLVERMGVKNGAVLWPVRVALSGKQSTPGGATEIAWILGKDETVRRIRDGIGRLSV